MIQGFSKLDRAGKIELLVRHNHLSAETAELLNRYLHSQDQALFDDISENTLSNFLLPYGVAPNFRINGTTYVVPMVTEESSVVAAAAKGARFWAAHGGFQTKVVQTLKLGQIVFTHHGSEDQLQQLLPQLREYLVHAIGHLTANMERRGGGIRSMAIHRIENVSHTWQLLVGFDTADSMGANFINTCLEMMAPDLRLFLEKQFPALPAPEIVMAILSNYTPDCLVECTVSCPVDALAELAGSLSPLAFARKFERAVLVARHDVHRAVTHNKGIMNGVDAVVVATGNDFRAVEAGVHAYAAAGGRYRGLTQVDLSDTHFTYRLQLPLALGTVGGLTGVHPLARLSLTLLQNPDAPRLMEIAAAAGMANNFMAITSLVTHGIQKGHMKMHLSNILNSLGATPAEKELAFIHFQSQTVSYSQVDGFLKKMRHHD
ncbi:MAG: hydroxymethylglutaryl-CoA reductase [Breznakibacter sp.]